MRIQTGVLASLTGLDLHFRLPTVLMCFQQGYAIIGKVENIFLFSF